MESNYIENKKKYIGVLGAFGLSVGTSIGWGSFVVTGSDYLSQAGLLGSIIGILLGALLMGVIAYCYHYMINKNPDSGGIYSFVKHTFGGDHAFLASWFLIIVYTGILWANVTSVALFSRFLMGGVFQFGKMYSIAGYDVYLGEVLLCTGVLFLIGGLTFLNKKITTNIAFGLVAIFIAGIIFVSLFTLINQNGVSFEEVAFAHNDNYFGQIVSVLAMSPWAFIGFESISHSAGSFSFKTKKTLTILLVSLVFSTLIYILLCQISVMAHPDNYASWLDYIANNHEEGIMGIPPFYVAYHYLGDAGTIIFAITLFSIVATSIIGNIYALTNLIQRMAEDGIFPKKFAYVNKNDIPVYVRLFILGLTFLAIFIGRSAISFIVDVNNIGGVLVYAYVSACALWTGKRKSEKAPMVFGALGLAASLVFGISHIAPVFIADRGMPQETFIVFVVFSLIGFLFFAFTLKQDTKGNFGNSSVVWVGLSILVAFFSGTWIIERSKVVHESMLQSVAEYYDSLHGATADPTVLKDLERQADEKNMAGIITLFIIVSLTLLVLFYTLHLIKNKEKSHQKQIKKMNEMMNHDPLTGMFNHRCFINNERRIVSLTLEDPNYRFAIVMCDVNDLKYFNDKYGHDYGDDHLCQASITISNIFNKSPVFRLGGDEFAVILEEDALKDKDKLVKKLIKESTDNSKMDDGVVIAVGMAENMGGETFMTVYHRADEMMYANKRELKEKRPGHSLR